MSKETFREVVKDIISIPSFYVIVIMTGVCFSLIFGDLEKLFDQFLSNCSILLLKLVLFTIVLSYIVIIKIEVKYLKKKKND